MNPSVQPQPQNRVASPLGEHIDSLLRQLREAMVQGDIELVHVTQSSFKFRRVRIEEDTLEF